MILFIVRKSEAGSYLQPQFRTFLLFALCSRSEKRPDSFTFSVILFFSLKKCQMGCDL